jgi:hypothetical protein
MLAILHGNGDTEHPLVQAEYHEITSVLSYGKSLPAQSFKSLISPSPNIRRFGIVIVLNISAQVIGSNIVSSYVGTVLESAGITNTHQQLIINLGINIFNIFCACAGSFAMEYIGRKGMLLGTSMAMTLMLVLMAILSALYGDGSNAAAGKGMTAYYFLVPWRIQLCVDTIDIRLPGEDLELHATCQGSGSRPDGVLCFWGRTPVHYPDCYR